MINTSKQSQLMHNINVYLFNICLFFFHLPLTRFGNNYVIIKGATSNYIRWALKCELKDKG
jgi:hypothetical protein